MTEKNSQTGANKRRQEENKARAKYLSNRSRARSFIKNQSTLEDLDELEKLIAESKKRLYKGLELKGESQNLINQIKNPIIKGSKTLHSSPHFVASYFRQTESGNDDLTVLTKSDGTFYTIPEIDSLLKLISSDFDNDYKLTFSVVKNAGIPMYYFSDLSGPINNDVQN